jgi:hypothetical protein
MIGVCDSQLCLCCHLVVLGPGASSLYSSFLTLSSYLSSYPLISFSCFPPAVLCPSLWMIGICDSRTLPVLPSGRLGPCALSIVKFDFKLLNSDRLSRFPMKEESDILGNLFSTQFGAAVKGHLCSAITPTPMACDCCWPSCVPVDY